MQRKLLMTNVQERLETMPAGRPRKPVAIHRKQATYRNDRHSIQAETEAKFKGFPVKPRRLSKEEGKIWKQIISWIPKEVLAAADTFHVEAACRWLVVYDTNFLKSIECADDPVLAESFERRASKAWATADKILLMLGATAIARAKLKIPDSVESKPQNALSRLGIIA